MTDHVTFSEADWKTLRRMKDELLQRASITAIERVHAIIAGPEADAHKKYIDLWSALKVEDAKIARMFNDMKRSNALFKIFEMTNNQLLTAKEVETFTQDTRDRIKEMQSANQAVKQTVAIGTVQMTGIV